MDNSEIIKKLVEAQIQLKFLHWQTKSFARHKAYGEIYGAFNELIDDFVEVYMGKYGRVEFTSGQGNIVLQNTSTLGLNEFLNQNLYVRKQF